MSGKEWYFFNLVSGHKKGRSVWPKGSRAKVDRKTPEGQWISGGTKREILVDGKIVGWEKNFTFYARTNGGRKKTNWYMMEYRSSKDDYIYPKGALLAISKIYTKVTPAQLQMEPSLAHKIVANEGNTDMTQDRESSLDGEQDLYSKKVSTVAVPKVGQSILNGETSSSKTITSSRCLSLPGFLFHPTDNELMEHYLKRKGSSTPFIVGSMAEVAYTHENVPVAWYTATVTEIISEKVLLVEYLSLKIEDGSLLRETVSIQNIRPCPPSILEVRDFQLLDIVEAFYNSGWWQGVIAAVKDQTEYNVKLMLLEDEIISSNTELKVVCGWIDEEWILASQDESLESQNNVESLHACSPLNKRKDPDPVATSISNVDISGLLPLFKKKQKRSRIRKTFPWEQARKKKRDSGG